MGIWPFDKTIVKFSKKSGKTEYPNPSSWRPISITSRLGKVVERVIDRRPRSSAILDIDEQQFGFQPDKSTLHYLSNLYHDILAMKNLPIATVYDLEKAFDSVDQTIAKQAKKQRFNGPMFATIKSFLSNRKVSIQINDFIDMSFGPLNGLPKGLYCHHFCFYFI